MAQSTQVLNIEFLVFNWIRTHIEYPTNIKHIPSAIKYLIHKFTKKCFDTKILTIKEDLDLMQIMLTQLNCFIHRFDLLFRASNSAYSSEAFHQACDKDDGCVRKSFHSVVIVESDWGNKFGGFTTRPWFNKSNYFWRDDQAFLFLLKSHKTSIQQECPWIFDIKPDVQTQAICCDPSYGPVFGGTIGNELGNDIYIGDAETGPEEIDGHIFTAFNWSKLKSYENSKYPDDQICGGDCARLLGRSDGDLEYVYLFNVKEYEVFEVIE